MIYERIKSLTKGKISINQLEKELGISSGSLCKIDKNKPSSDKLQKIADYLGVSVDYLLTGEDKSDNPYYLNEETSQIAQEIFDNQDLKMLFDTTKDCSPEDMKKVIAMVKAFKGEI